MKDSIIETIAGIGNLASTTGFEDVLLTGMAFAVLLAVLTLVLTKGCGLGASGFIISAVLSLFVVAMLVVPNLPKTDTAPVSSQRAQSDSGTLKTSFRPSPAPAPTSMVP